DEKTPGTILAGEVLDLSCYLSHGGRGKEHKKCAKMCILDGGPAGLLTDEGAVVLFVENHDKKKEYKSLANYAGDKVKATGTLVNKNGMRALVLDKLEPAK
ncbi:MAG: hypothetical protein HY551_01915, partial [Elusimicrobia bacterium]|nr:hypothetical protein [Elusimicrobiota bacterium]